MTIKRYAHRDPIELDAKGGYYMRHVEAMTAEGLHDKSAIAAELGWRDYVIDRCLAELAAKCVHEIANLSVAEPRKPQS